MKLTLRQSLLMIFSISALGFVAPAALSQVPQVGLEFEGFGLNAAQITITQFLGECSGQEYEPLKAHFTSSVNPPSSGRRVVIRNITEGINSTKIPYTDREYDNGRGSQGIKMIPGSQHQKTAFVFIPNKVNTFEFDILQNKQVVEQGIFDSLITTNNRTLQRNIHWVSETFCIDTGTTYMDGCKNPGVREKGACPGSYTYQYRNIKPLNEQNQNQPIIIINPR